jgi:AraC-like DNA-binding protein
MGTSCAATIHNVDDLAGLLQLQYRVLDLEPRRPTVSSSPALQLEAAGLQLGEIGLTSIWGSALALEVEPLVPLCLLALPAIGWGRYQLEDGQLDNTFGETIAFLPARGWRLINDHTGGTGVQFSAEALKRRVLAMRGGEHLPEFEARMAQPWVLKTAQPQVRVVHQQLQHALAMVDASVRAGLGAPHPMLQLDDLILRCIALLLFPQLQQHPAPAQRFAASRDRQREIRSLMAWMQVNLHRSLSLTEIEQHCFYGRRAIQDGFKAEVGCGPMQWLRRQRLKSAWELLQDPVASLTVTQVAQRCGYINLSAFSRDFSSHFGVSPRQLQRQARLAQPAGPDRP